MKKVLVMMLALLVVLSGCSSVVDTETTTTEAKFTTRITTTAAPTTAATTVATTTNAPTTAEPTTPTTTLSLADTRAGFPDIDYKTVARDPDTYKDQKMKITGKVVQVIEDDTMPQYRIAQNDDSDQIWYVMYLRLPGDIRILEDDTVTVYGSCGGLLTYTSTMGGAISIPSLTSTDIELISE